MSKRFAGLCVQNAGRAHSTVQLRSLKKLNLGEVQAYRPAALPDNDFVVTIFTVAGTHNEEVEQWMSEQKFKEAGSKRADPPQAQGNV